MVSVKDVARAAGVSVGTVSNVLNRPEGVRPEILERVHREIERLGYVRNDAARQLRAGRSRSIGLVVPDLRNPFFADVARGAHARASREGLTVLVADSAGDAELESAHIALFTQQRAFGVLITPVGDLTEAIRGTAANGLRTVLVDHAADDSGLASVSVDNVAGGRMVVEHLAAIGARSIAVVGGVDAIGQVHERRLGARAAADRLDCTVEFVDSAELSVDAGRAIGRALVGRPGDDRPAGVFALNDQVALGLIQAVTAAGEPRIPEEMAIVGYDDIDYSASALVPLSSMRQPTGALGATAVEMLVDPEASRTARFLPELVVRASTGGSGASATDGGASR